MFSDPSSAQSIGWLVLSCFALAGGLNQLHALAKRWRGTEDGVSIRPQPLIVRAEDQWVSKQQFEAYQLETRRAIENIFSKIGGVERGFKAELDEKIRAVQEKVNDMAVDLGAVKREAEIHTAQLNVMSSDIKQLLSRQ